MTLLLPSESLSSSRLSPRPWRELSPLVSPLSPGTLASYTETTIGHSSLSPPLTPAPLSPTQSVPSSAQVTKSPHSSSISRVGLTMSMQRSSAPTSVAKGSTTTWLLGSSPLCPTTLAVYFSRAHPVSFPLSVGTPQDSPVSPLLFVIYVSPLHIPVPKGLVLSYVDDFSVTISSPSYRSNSRALQHIFGCLRAIVHTRCIDFSVSKTELIHWRTPVQTDPSTASWPPPVALDG